MWAVSREEVDELERPTHYHRKTMVTAFCSGKGKYFPNFLLRSPSINTSDFAGEVIGGLEDVCYPEVRNPHERQRMLHFDNAPVGNTRIAMEQFAQSEIKRMGHPPYSLDLAPCDFFLVVYMKDELRGTTFAEEKELLAVLSERMSEILPDTILRVFADWDRWLWRCLLMEGECVEESIDLSWFLADLDERAWRVRI
jgi:histone-lysine N-methyltransferase SETMAR